MAKSTIGKLTVVEDNTGGFEKALCELANSVVMVGIPEAAGSHGDIGNAALGYIHETGSPANNIPARPFLQPAIKDSEAQWSKHLKQAAKDAFDGKSPEQGFNAAGITAVSAVKNKIAKGIPPPLKQSTVATRKRRVKSRKASTAAGTTPLVDTGQLLNSVTYVVKRGRD